MIKKKTGYHATSQDAAKNIIKSGFNVTKDSKNLPNDLGHGVYTFINKPGRSSSPIKNCVSYAHTYLQHEKNIAVLEVNVSVDSDYILDMNDPENEDEFVLFYNENLELIVKELKDLSKNNRRYRRGNFDGIVIELMLKNYDMDPHIIIKDTYTRFKEHDFEELRDYKRSNQRNAREMAIRELDTITSIDTIK